MGCKASKPELALEQPATSPKVVKPTGTTGSKSAGTATTSSAAVKPIGKPPPAAGDSGSGGLVAKKNGSAASSSQSHHSASSSKEADAAAALAAAEKQATVYNMLLDAQSSLESMMSSGDDGNDMANRVLAVCGADPQTARYQHPETKATPLHLAVQLLDNRDGHVALGGTDILSIVEGLVQVYPDAVQIRDAQGNIPLHYAISPSHIDLNFAPPQPGRDEAEAWGPRSAVLQLLLTTDIEGSLEYLMRNDVVYNKRNKSGGVTPLYRAIQALPDDFEPFSVTYEFISILRDACGEMVGVGNKGDGDKPLALLYRRFTRQFDLAEKFFEGDNSRQEVVDHRFRYKTAAANTWKIIECLLRPDAAPNGPSTSSPLRQLTKTATAANQEWRLVHRAVQVETPPDLLRYIVETNAEDLTKPDHEGNLPLHYAAKSKPVERASGTSFPPFYIKYVIDELLYKFPEAAGMMDAKGKFPLTLAVESGKQWINGGIKSLYDAFPGAIEQIDLNKHESLRRALQEDGGSSSFVGEEKSEHGVIRDEHHDSIMLVQQNNVDIAEVVTSMWAHEEDAGVQMLACVAVCRIVQQKARNNPEYLLRISLSAVAAVVNAMKAHPNEVIVQEKACQALKVMASTDGQQEISFVASGAVAAVVGAMQAHVSDPNVQEEACGAITEIIKAGGSDRATIVASVSGITALLNALAAHPNVAEVQKNACMALDAMTCFTDANLPELPRTQTEPLLEAALRKFPKECRESARAVMDRLV